MIYKTMTRDQYNDIVRLYNAIMNEMTSANAKASGKSTPIRDLRELVVDIATHLPAFMAELASMEEYKIPDTTAKLMRLPTVLGGDPPRVIQVATLLLAGLANVDPPTGTYKHLEKNTESLKKVLMEVTEPIPKSQRDLQ